MRAWESVIRRLAPALGFLAGAGLTILVHFLVSEAAEQRERAFIERAFDRSERRLQQRLQEALTPIAALAIFVDGERAPSAARFEVAAAGASRLGIPISRIAWEPRIAAADRDAFEQDARLSGLAEFAIKEFDAEARLIPAGQRAEYFPIRLERLAPGFPSALGFDLASDPARRAVIERARDEARPIAIVPAIRQASVAPEIPYIVYWPLFGGNEPPPSVDDRRAQLSGYVTVVLSLSDLLKFAIADAGELSPSLRIRIVEEGDVVPRPIGTYREGMGWLAAGSPEALLRGSVQTREFLSLGVRWLIDFEVDAHAFRRDGDSPGIVVLASGGLVTVMLTAWLFLLSTRETRIRRLVAERTSALATANVSLGVAREELGTILDHVVEAVITIDHRGRILTCNRPTERIFGYAADELVGRNIRDLMPEPDRSNHDSYLQQYLTTGQARIIGRGRLTTARRRDGTVFPIDLGIGELPAAGGSRRFVGTIRDATERIRAEERLRNAEKMEALGLLAGSIAHDFNNLLAAASTFAEFLVEDLDPASPSAVHADRLVRIMAQGKDVVGQILSYARPDAGQRALIDPVELVPEVLAQVQATRSTNASVAVECLGLDGELVLADRSQLAGILANLIANALDALPVAGGSVTVTLDKTTASARGERPPHLPGSLSKAYVGNLDTGTDYVTIAVADTGSGIPPQSLHRIFDPFYTTKPRGRGTGLGLAIVQSAVATMAGSIEVESLPGAGTTVTIFLPVATAEQKAAGGNPQPRSRKSRAPAADTSTDRASGATILIVDDDPKLAEGIATGLGRAEMRATIAPDAETCLALIAEDPGGYDLVLTDLGLPGMDGIELARRISLHYPVLPVLLFTGRIEASLVERAQASGIVKVIRKPAMAAELADAIRTTLDRSPSPTARVTSA